MLGILIIYCKKNYSLSTESLVLGKLARYLCLQNIFVVGERAKRASHYQGCTNSCWCGIYIYYKYSTLPRGISINIVPKVGIFPEAEGRGKYSLPRVQYYRYSTRKS